MDSEVEFKKPKLCENVVTTAATCAHWVQRKKRYCKMSVKAGQQYCGEHEPAVTETAENAAENARILCPLDAKHTVNKKHLEKHLKICNARTKAETYIEKGINAGADADLDDGTAASNTLRLNELPDVEFYGIIDKAKDLHAKHVNGHIESLQLQHKSLATELEKSEYGAETRKHLVQAAALLGILEHKQQLLEHTRYIEFGAGKGQLAYYLARLLETLENSQVILLDRMSLRHKKDNKIEDRSLVRRIRADIADFNMNGLELLRGSERCVAVSKHLCGAATDLTLRCITQSLSADTPQTEFILIALCCHHRCEWRSYVGKEFFQRQGLTSRDFAVMTKMASWAICGTGMSRERRRALEEQSLSPETVRDTGTTQRLSLAEREHIGIICKRVLDYGRLEYLRENGYAVELKEYVPRAVTLENICLIAQKQKINGTSELIIAEKETGTTA